MFPPSFTTCGLHQQIKKEYGSNVVPAFPPKKIFTLTPAEVEQRREQLEKYMQASKLFMQNKLFTDGLYCISLHSDAEWLFKPVFKLDSVF